MKILFLALLPALDASPQDAGAPDGAVVGPAEAFRETAATLGRFIESEREAKGIPAISIALVDGAAGEGPVWAAGFGLQDPERKVPATAETVYRVGSVSKLFTDLAAMRLVERGDLDLDAPASRYLPDFTPANPFEKPVTLRLLMSHRAGLVREPPVGHYFDPTSPSLAATVRSLGATTLVYPPGARTKYSNGGVAAVGYALERLAGRPFAEIVDEALLRPLGMRSSSFQPGEAIRTRSARATMWTAHGRTFPAPEFPLGTSAAGELRSSVLDLARFLRFLVARGRAPDGKEIVRRETLESMWKPQFAEAGAASGFGLGFLVSSFEGHRRVGHNGAVYGFATELAFLPEDGLGVAVAASLDVSNAVTRRIADQALRAMLAVKRGERPPAIESTARIAPEEARKLRGHYEGGPEKARTRVDLFERIDELALVRDGIPAVLRARAGAAGSSAFVVDDAEQGMGPEIRLGEAGGILLDGKALAPAAPARPEASPARFEGLVGEYGWDHDILYILEREGKLWALIEWFFPYPLEETAGGDFRFPDFGLYAGEKVKFTRGADGVASEVDAASVVWKRRPQAAAGSTFRVVPRRPLAELRAAMGKEKPPAEPGEHSQPDLVDLASLDPTIHFDIRYATANNFLGEPLYASARAFLQRPAAEALLRAHRRLARDGYGLLIHDAYRPWRVTKLFWDAVSDEQHGFVADPRKGSRHNRGAAVDLTLYDLKTGEPAAMPSGYDEFSDRAWPLYPGGTSLERWRRDLLRLAMEAEGFSVYQMEWWHFDFLGWERYPVMDVPFEEVKAAGG